MKNIILTLSLFLCFCIYSMDQEPFVSSSSSPSACSADQEALTFEQRQKNEEESKGTRDQDSQAASTLEVDHEADWYCQCRFPKTNNELGWLNTAKSLVGAKQTNYDDVQVCDLDDGKLGVLTGKDKFYTIRILDINSGKCLHNINPLKDEKGIKLIPTQLCKLSENRFACILNSDTRWGEGQWEEINKKIKIYDINSGKLLKDIIVEEFGDMNGVYLSENRMALLTKDLYKDYRFIFILDLSSGKILKKIDLIKEEQCGSLLTYVDVFGMRSVGSSTGVYINQALPLYGDRLLLQSGNNLCVIYTNIDETNLLDTWNILDVIVLPNGEFLSLSTDFIVRIWDNENFKFQKVQDVLNENNLIVTDLQNMVLSYLPKDWNSKIVVDKIDTHVDKFILDNFFRHGRKCFLDENHILAFNRFFDYITSGYCAILNVETGESKIIFLTNEFLSKMDKDKFWILDHGKRIAFYARDGSIEIWTNQPKVTKKEVQEGCIIC